MTTRPFGRCPRYLSVIALLLLALPASADTPKPKIGALIPLTGGYAAHGTLVFRGMQLGAGEAFEWVIEDIGTMNARDATSAAQKLLAGGVIAATGFGIDDAEWVAPLFNRKEVPLVIAWDSGPRVAELGPYVFSAGYEITSGARAAARYLAEKERVETASVIAEESAYNRIAVRAFIDESKTRGIRILSEDWHNLGDKEFTSSFLRAKTKGAKGIYFLPSLPEAFDAGRKQMEVLKLRVALVSNELIVPTPTASAHTHPGGCGSWIPDDKSAEVTEKYEARFGEAPWNHGPLVVGYEAGAYLRKVLGESGSAPDAHAALREALGPDQRLDKQFAIWCWERGRLVRKL